jgi:hypothetical protein
MSEVSFICEIPAKSAKIVDVNAKHMARAENVRTPL